MKPIYGPDGRAIAWLERDVFYNLDGLAIAALQGETVSDFDGEHLGRLDNGHIRDREGSTVAFMIGAQGGPITPPPGRTPERPILQVPPLPPIAMAGRIHPIPTYVWSELTWEQFLSGRDAADLAADGHADETTTDDGGAAAPSSD